MSDFLSEEIVKQNIHNAHSEYSNNLAKKYEIDTHRLLDDFPKGHTWELPETTLTLPTNVSDKMKLQHGKVPHIPEATYEHNSTNAINSGLLEGQPRYLFQDIPFTKGGMSHVFKGYDRNMGRLVAMKVQAYDPFASKQNRERLEKEAKVIANIRHPYIIDVYAYTQIDRSVYNGISGEGPFPAVIMEYVEPNTNLKIILKKHQLPPEEVSIFMNQISSAIDFMADKGILHRDLKPGNLFWDAKNKVGKICDFGLANTADPNSEALGTPSYLSPEGAFDINKVDLSSEVFALATVAFEALTSERRFEGDSGMEIMMDILSMDGFKEKHQIELLKKKLAGTTADYKKVVEVFNKAQLNDKKKRYQTAIEFSRALSEALISNK